MSIVSFVCIGLMFTTAVSCTFHLAESYCVGLLMLEIQQNVTRLQNYVMTLEMERNVTITTQQSQISSLEKQIAALNTNENKTISAFTTYLEGAERSFGTLRRTNADNQRAILDLYITVNDLRRNQKRLEYEFANLKKASARYHQKISSLENSLVSLNNPAEQSVVAFTVGIFMLLVLLMHVIQYRMTSIKLKNRLQNKVQVQAASKTLQDEEYVQEKQDAETMEAEISATQQRNYVKDNSAVRSEESDIRIVKHQQNEEQAVVKTDFLAYSFQEGAAHISHDQMLNSIIHKKEIEELVSSSPSREHILVKTAQDLNKVESSKVAFLFMDQNEQHRILDNKSDHGQNIRKGTLVRAFKLSDVVIVIYCWDVLSKNLDLGQLYSPRLEESLDNPLLQRLKIDQSFYSIYKSFSSFQFRHIINKIKVCLKDM